MENVAVIIPTYNRREVLRQCMVALQGKLKGANLKFYIGNDHSQPIDILYPAVKIFNNPTGSLGANLNRLIKAAIADGYEYLFQLDDDHILNEQIDLTPHIAALNRGDIGWVRLMGVDAHNYTATLKDGYWLVDWGSAELYITSNRPHLKRADFHDYFGFYPEGKKLGQTEEQFCNQAKDVARDYGGKFVAVPLTYNDKMWDHVGHSWQGKGF